MSDVLPTDIRDAAVLFGMRPVERFGIYKISDKRGQVVDFKVNHSQSKVLQHLHSHNLILKSRQQGISTLIQILFLDTALFRENTLCGTIADTLDNATALIGKIKFAYKHLPDCLKELVPIVKSNETEIEFKNGSRIQVGVSLRSGTYQRLHISEYGPICASSPLKAEEIRAGALNTVSPEGGMVFIESTAAGAAGDFYDKCAAAAAIKGQGRAPVVGEYKLHFLPWYDDPTCRIKASIDFEPREREYFAAMQYAGVALEDEQKAFYALKWREQGEKMWPEYPSTFDEAFAAPRDGAFFTREMLRVRESGRVCSVPYDRRYPVYGAWDIGVAETTVCTAFQLVGNEIRLIDCLTAKTNSLEDFIFDLKATGYQWGMMFLPHDGKTPRTLTEGGRSISAQVRAYFKVTDIPRTVSFAADIEIMRRFFDRLMFDREKTAFLQKSISAFSKKWSNVQGRFLIQPDDGALAWANHASDSLRYICVVLSTMYESLKGTLQQRENTERRYRFGDFSQMQSASVANSTTGY